MKQYKLQFNLIGVLVIFAGLIGGYWYYKSQNVIHIATVGPLSGQSPANGHHQLQGIQMYLDEINGSGGINGKKIVLDVYDDKNDPELAREKAMEIVRKNKAVAVIGHNYSSCSISAGEIYKSYQIPAISPSSTDIDVTLGNDWYFRVVYNNKLQGRLLANYVATILKEDSVSIIHEDLAYGSELAQIFEYNLKKLGVRVQNKWEITTGDEFSGRKMENIVDQFSGLKSSGVLFLAVHAPEGVRLVKLIKDAGIKNMLIGPNALASKEFVDGFLQYSKEKVNPGYYSNGMHVITPLVFDSAGKPIHNFKVNYLLKYNEEPDWRAVFAYEAAKIVIEAIKKTKIAGLSNSIQADRNRIKDFLSHLTKLNSVEGITGYNYFDENGDSPRTISIGVYKNKKVISALTQIRPLLCQEEMFDLQKALAEERIVAMDNGYMYKTNVVYAGVKFNEISNIDLSKRTATLDLTLWFRYQGNVNVTDIEFLNSVEKIQLEKPVKSQIINKINYDAYHVKGDFKVDYSEGVFAFDRHLIGISFRNRKLTQENLIYVVDIIGMEMAEGSSISKPMIDSKVLTQHHTYSVNQIRYFQDTIRIGSMGNPEFLNTLKKYVEYSKLDAGLLVKKKSITLRGLIPAKYLNALTITCIAAIVLLSFSNKWIGKKWFNFVWLLKFIFMFVLLLSGEASLASLLAETSDFYYLNLLVITFDILWWLISAYLVNSLIHRFLMDTLEKKTNRVIPTLVRRFVRFSIFFLAISGIIAFVYEQKITSLLATSGLVAMIIGLAIQINISNIFSGIAINLEVPFRINDWVKIGKFDEGRIVDITWRSTRIKTRNGSILSIPNSTASESVILNYNYPDDNCSMYFLVNVDLVHRFERVQKVLLDAVISAEGVLGDPPPSVTFSQFTDWSAEYAVAFYINEYGKRVTYTRNVWKRIYIHLSRAGITPLVKRQEIHMAPTAKSQTPEDPLIDMTINNMDIFQTLSEEGMSAFNQRIKVKKCSEGELISSPDNDFFIIAEGVIEVNGLEQEAVKNKSPRLGVEDLFQLPNDRSHNPVVYKSITKSILLGFSKSDAEYLGEDGPLFTQILDSFIKIK